MTSLDTRKDIMISDIAYRPAIYEAGVDYDPEILLPNRYCSVLKVVKALCPCGESINVHDGHLTVHNPPMYNGPALRDPLLPGTSLCRYTGRAVTLEAARRRDAKLTEGEERIQVRLWMQPWLWLGLLDWVGLGELKAGDRVGFTQTGRGDNGQFLVYERTGTVKRKGKTFAQVADDGGGEARLTAKAWKNARVRRIDDARCR